MRQAGIAIEDLPEGMMMEYRDGFGIAVNYSDQEYDVPGSSGCRIYFRRTENRTLWGGGLEVNVKIF
jgi:beta-galactosidase